MFGKVATIVFGLTYAALSTAFAQTPPQWPLKEGDFVIKDFHFRSGETLPELKIHYRTVGTPKRSLFGFGSVTNAVMLLHGTTGSGKGFLSEQFAGELFGPGQPLDITKYYIIMPDAIGTGNSSKPSDGLKAKFPKYDYADMVEAQHRLLMDGLKVEGLELLFGTSMGCMHAFMWGETYPTFAKRLMPMACVPAEIAGRNRVLREMTIDAVRNDPAYQNGNYTSPPLMGLHDANFVFTLFVTAAQRMQVDYPTREKADAYVDAMAREAPPWDANDLIWQLDASRTYDPSADLEKITAKVLWINTADDFVNPPSTGLAEKYAPRIKNGKYVLIPISLDTVGHRSHSKAVLWKDKMAAFMSE